MFITCLWLTIRMRDAYGTGSCFGLMLRFLGAENCAVWQQDKSMVRAETAYTLLSTDFVCSYVCVWYAYVSECV